MHGTTSERQLLPRGYLTKSFALSNFCFVDNYPWETLHALCNPGCLCTILMYVYVISMHVSVHNLPHTVVQICTHTDHKKTHAPSCCFTVFKEYAMNVNSCFLFVLILSANDLMKSETDNLNKVVKINYVKDERTGKSGHLFFKTANECSQIFRLFN